MNMVGIPGKFQWGLEEDHKNVSPQNQQTKQKNPKTSSAY